MSRDYDNFARQYEVDEWGCWIWTGSTHGEGYGNFYADGRDIAAHRYSWLVANSDKELPSGRQWQVHHKCDQPACVNPDHLELVTAAYNSQQRQPYKHGMAIRKEMRGGGCPHGHAADRQRVRADGYAICQDCANEYQKRRRREKGLLKPQKPIDHGTYNGYRMHKRRDEKPCDECREANRNYQREWQRKTHNRKPRSSRD